MPRFDFVPSTPADEKKLLNPEVYKQRLQNLSWAQDYLEQLDEDLSTLSYNLYAIAGHLKRIMEDIIAPLHELDNELSSGKIEFERILNSSDPPDIHDSSWDIHGHDIETVCKRYFKRIMKAIIDQFEVLDNELSSGKIEFEHILNPSNPSDIPGIEIICKRLSDIRKEQFRLKFLRHEGEQLAFRF